MLLKAAKEYNIDLTESWVVGDSDSDVMCGKNAGCRTAFIGSDNNSDICGINLLDCIRKILE